MEQLVMEVIKYIGGILFFIYGLPVVISLICETASWVESMITGKKSTTQLNYYDEILKDSKSFMHTRR